jgi:hypothetical protein
LSGNEAKWFVFMDFGHFCNLPGVSIKIENNIIPNTLAITKMEMKIPRQLRLSSAKMGPSWKKN